MFVRIRRPDLDVDVVRPAVDLDPRVVERRERERAEPIEEVDHAHLLVGVEFTEVEKVLFAVVAPRLVGLRSGLDGAGLDCGPHLTEEVDTRPLDAPVDVLARVGERGLDLARRHHVAGVDALVHVVDRRASREVVDDAPDVGVVATRLGEDSGVDVETAVRRDREHLRGDDVGEAGGDDDVGFDRRDEVEL